MLDLTTTVSSRIDPSSLLTVFYIFKSGARESPAVRFRGSPLKYLDSVIYSIPARNISLLPLQLYLSRRDEL